MVAICPVLKQLGSPVFKWHSNTRPFVHPTPFDHLNTRLVWYSDPHSTVGIRIPTSPILEGLKCVKLKNGLCPSYDLNTELNFLQFSGAIQNQDQCSNCIHLIWHSFQNLDTKKSSFEMNPDFGCLVLGSPQYSAEQFSVVPLTRFYFNQ